MWMVYTNVSIFPVDQISSMTSCGTHSWTASYNALPGTCTCFVVVGTNQELGDCTAVPSPPNCHRTTMGSHRWTAGDAVPALVSDDVTGRWNLKNHQLHQRTSVVGYIPHCYYWGIRYFIWGIYGGYNQPLRYMLNYINGIWWMFHCWSKNTYHIDPQHIPTIIMLPTVMVDNQLLSTKFSETLLHGNQYQPTYITHYFNWLVFQPVFTSIDQY